MQVDPQDGELGPGESAYDHWDRLLEPVPRHDSDAEVLLRPALAVPASGDAAAKQHFAEVRAAWQFGRDRWDDLDADDDEDTAELSARQYFWAEDHTRDICSKHSESFAALLLGKAVVAPRQMPEFDRMPVRQGPDAGSPVVAVIDDGIAFLNRRFLRRAAARDGQRYRTRFHSIWLQAFRTVPRPPFGGFYTHAGQVLYGHEIDALLARGRALDEGAVYRDVMRGLLDPGAHRSLEMSFTHGTHVLDIAAGADPDEGDPVSGWPLIAVQLPPEAVDNTSGAQLEPCIVQAVRWVLTEARRLGGKGAVIINISFATFAGPKDGTKAIEATVAHLLASWERQTGRVARVVYAYGNDWPDRQIARFHVGSDWQAVDWCVQPDNRAASILEIRADRGADLGRLCVTLARPGQADAADLSPLPAGAYRVIRDATGALCGHVYNAPAHVTAPGVTTPPALIVALAPTAERFPAGPRAPAGAWRLDLRTANGAAFGARVEVQRGDTPTGYRLSGRQSYLDHTDAYEWEASQASYGFPGPACPITRQGTQSSFATALTPHVYTVAALTGDPCSPGLRPSRYSAEASVWAQAAPVLSATADRAPGFRGTIAAGTGSGSARTSNGTSVAAAQVTRAIARVLASGVLPFVGTTSSTDPPELSALLAAATQAVTPAAVGRLGRGAVTADAGRGPR